MGPIYLKTRNVKKSFIRKKTSFRVTRCLLVVFVVAALSITYLNGCKQFRTIEYNTLTSKIMKEIKAPILGNNIVESEPREQVNVVQEVQPDVSNIVENSAQKQADVIQEPQVDGDIAENSTQKLVDKDEAQAESEAQEQVTVVEETNVVQEIAPQTNTATEQVEDKELHDKDEVEKAPLSITGDPFAIWPRRDQVPDETMSAALKTLARGESCYKNSVTSVLPNSLDQVALAIKKKLSNPQSEQKLVFAVLGDSVAADINGFVQALQSFFTLSQLIPFPVEVRNYALGGTGPRFTYFCNQLRGDEDIVVYENVRPYEPDALFDLASSLVVRDYGVILAHWHGPATWNEDPNLFGFSKASNELNLPLINLPDSRERVKECLPANTDFSIPEEQQIYRDEVHPNRIGELILASMIGQVFEEAVMIYNADNLDWTKIKQNRLPSEMAAPVPPMCFSPIQCASTEEEEVGYTRCLQLKENNGFELKSLPSGKMWWEGTMPGHSIEFILPGSCSEVVMFHNLRVTNGMVRIDIDKSVPENIEGFTDGILDGWYEGYWWLPKSRGHLREIVLARDLQLAEQHTVRVTVLDDTHSEDGTFKFDFTNIACV